MHAKLMVVVLSATMLGAAVLILRQQRLELAHDIAQAHARIDRTRHALWDRQARIAQSLETQQLLSAMRAANLALEPVVPDEGAAESAGLAVVVDAHDVADVRE